MYFFQIIVLLSEGQIIIRPPNYNSIKMLEEKEVIKNVHFCYYFFYISRTNC